MQFCRKCNVPIYFNMRRMRATKTNPISSLNGLLYYKMGIIHSFTKRIKVYKREREGMNRKRFFASDNKNIQNNTAAVFIFQSVAYMHLTMHL